MRIAVFGAGVVGGFLAAKLTAAGIPVSAVARGAQLSALRSQGLRLLDAEGERRFDFPAVADARDLGPQDLVLLTLKAHSIPDAAPAIAALVGPETVLVAAQNGIPWWYFHREGGPLAERRIAAVDPTGSLFEILDPGRVIGCVVHIAAEMPEPGRIRHLAGNRFILGEPDGRLSERLERVAALLRGAGLAAETTPAIRYEIWQKLWGNVAFNPISALTLATMDRLIADPGSRRLALSIMGEAEQVANRLGIRFPISAEARIDGLKRLGAYKTSALQDIEAGRPVELGALLEAVLEIAAELGIPTPMLAAASTLARLRVATQR